MLGEDISNVRCEVIVVKWDVGKRVLFANELDEI